MVGGALLVINDPTTGAKARIDLLGLAMLNYPEDTNNGLYKTGNGYGMKLLDGKPEPYHQRTLAWVPRFGFAYDLNGDDGKTERGGFDSCTRVDGFSCSSHFFSTSHLSRTVR
jgi:hypothetical protein